MASDSADSPFALHITWTCYGTWLPGDERGHVSNTLLPQGGFIRKQNIPGTPYAPGDEYTRNRARNLQKHATARLHPDHANCVAESLINATWARDWRILRAAIMPDHVHVLVTDCPDDGPAVRRILKGVSQADLNRFIGYSRRWWTTGGSDRYKHGHQAIENADRYIANQENMLAAICNMEIVPVPDAPPG
jgi:REP element-mobilizing transposase RayT